MVTLNTAPGDGGLNVGVDAFGVFGSNAGGTETSDAFYDPLGEIGESGTVFKSSLAINILNDDVPERTFLAEGNLETPAFSNTTATTANSTFTFSSLNIVLDQEVSDFTTDGQRTGSDLLQTYTITNTSGETVEFELVRYLDGDLEFDSSISDTGGYYASGEDQILFETDSGDSGTDATTFVGIASTSEASTSSSYEISEYSGLETNIADGVALSNTIQGDGDDEDQFIDGEPYDVTMGYSNSFVLEPGASLTYDTATFFGSGIPEDVGSTLPINEDPTEVDVYRFLRTDTQTQFYTTTEIERETVLETLPQYELEGLSFVGAAPPAEGEDPLTGTSPIYRFFNTSTGIHLYTADENERAYVENNLDNYVAEGTPYYGYDTQVEGTVPLYRFYNAELDAHFYTPSTEERDFFLQSPDYEPEGGGDGIAFYVEPAVEL
jgi:Repeat of unknown function (DUF5648)